MDIYTSIKESNIYLDDVKLLKDDSTRLLGYALIKRLQQEFIRIEEIEFLQIDKQYQVNVLFNSKKELKINEINDQRPIELKHAYSCDDDAHDPCEYGLSLIGQTLILNFYKVNLENKKESYYSITNARENYKKAHLSYIHLSRSPEFIECKNPNGTLSHYEMICTFDTYYIE
jgi:hypothetical protein